MTLFNSWDVLPDTNAACGRIQRLAQTFQPSTTPLGLFYYLLLRCQNGEIQYVNAKSKNYIEKSGENVRLTG